MTRPTQIGIIGAGPAGLAALKSILDTDEYTLGQWVPTVFEASHTVGGVWYPSPASPLYDSLTTNLPHPIMAFSSFPFPPSTLLFPPANTVQTYLEAYTDAFQLRPHIQFDTRVTSVEWQAPYWHVRVDKRLEPYTFSLLLVCNGHHNTPRIPSLPGLESWLSPAHARASHSQTYRNPSSIPIPLENASILVIGGGPSGLDISAELLPLAKHVFLSTSTGAPPTPPSKCIIKPRTTLFSAPSTSSSSATVHFVDNTTEQIDYCVLATGYSVTFPFLQSSRTVGEDNPGFKLSSTLIPSTLPPLDHHPTHSLTNTSYSIFPLARHLFGFPECGFAPASFSNANTQSTLPPPTSIAFPGLLVRVAPLPVVEAQARAALAVFRSASASAFPTAPSNSNADETMHARDHHSPIDWAHESNLISTRHTMLTAKFHAARSASSSSPLPEPRPQSTAAAATIIPTQDTDNDAGALANFLSHEWDHLEPLDQFAYRDALDDLVCSLSLSSPSLSPSPSLLPPPSLSPSPSPPLSSSPPSPSPQPAPLTPNPLPPAPTRTRPWELPIHTHTLALRRAWRLIEALGAGEAEAWVRGVGSGESGRSGEEEWVELMWRVLKWGEGRGDEGEEIEGKAKEEVVNN